MSEKLHIGILGLRNKGKSLLMNVLSAQSTSIVSATPGTTTDAVKKSIEIFGLGNCVLVDTAGLDDQGALGQERINKSLKAIDLIDLCIFIFNHDNFSKQEEDILKKLEDKKIPFVLVHNMSDIKALSLGLKRDLEKKYPLSPIIDFSAKEAWEKAKQDQGNCPYLEISQALNQVLNTQIPKELSLKEQWGLNQMINSGDSIILVCPIDTQAPKGRLILPQVQIARQCLDAHASCIMVQPQELTKTISLLKQAPKLVITDSQAFKEVAQDLPSNIPLTSFSILLAYQKGNFAAYLKGTPKIQELREADRILILESCTHQVNCEDIGRVKIPNLLKNFTGKNLEFDFISGLDSIDVNPRKYSLIIQCGACMISKSQLERRISPFIEAGIPVSNYGLSLAFVTGIFDRAVQIFSNFKGSE